MNLLGNQNLVSAISSLPLKYFVPTLFDGTAFYNALGMAISSVVGDYIAGIKGTYASEMKEKLKRAGYRAIYAGAITAVLNSFGILPGLINGENYIFLAVFVYLGNMIADWIYAILTMQLVVG
jgi:hypothetical protein